MTRRMPECPCRACNPLEANTAAVEGGPVDFSIVVALRVDGVARFEHVVKKGILLRDGTVMRAFTWLALVLYCTSIRGDVVTPWRIDTRTRAPGAKQGADGFLASGKDAT